MLSEIDAMDTLTVHELLRFASVITVGMILILTAVASYFLERRHHQRPMFALVLFLLGWVTLTLGSAMSGVGRLFPQMFVVAPFLSGFIGPALFIHTRQVTAPHQTTSLNWMVFGLFGHAYSILSLTLPDGLHYVSESIIHGRPFWHPILSPLMTLQTVQLAAFILASTALITRAVWVRNHPDLSQTQFWLLVTCWTCLGIVVLTNVLPTFKIFLLEVEPALVILPIAIVGCLSVRALGAELKIAHDGHVEARANRMESLGTMARGLAHDLNNILAGVTGHAEVAKIKLDNRDVAVTHLDQIIDGSHRAAELLNRMMTFSGRTDGIRPTIDPRSSVEAAFTAVAPLQSSSCRMRIELAPDLPLVRIEPNELLSAIDNLLANSIDAIGEQPGQVTLRAFHESSAQVPADAIGSLQDGQDALCIEVEDTGAGMSPAQASRALEPFFSTRPDGKGLGLVGVLSTVKGAGGALWFRSELGSGTRFVIWLPVVTDVPAEALSHSVIRPRSALVVDDEPEITRLLSDFLESLTIRAYCFDSGESALSFLDEPTSPTFNLAIVDIRLEGMDGIELGHRLIHDYGCAGIMIISGDEPGPRLAQFAGQPVVFHRKPLTLGALRDGLQDLGMAVS